MMNANCNQTLNDIFKDSSNFENIEKKSDQCGDFILDQKREGLLDTTKVFKFSIIKVHVC